MSERIRVIRAGGTYDSKPYDDPQHPPPYVETLKGKDSPVWKALSALPLGRQADLLEWESPERENRFVKDSKDYTEADIRELAKVIKSDPHQHVIVLHGTDEIVRDARWLKAALGDTGKTVALAGAIVPLSMHHNSRRKSGAIVDSDGIPSLDFALSQIREKTPGVYVIGRNAETGRMAFFPPDEVHKDWDRSFEKLQFSLAWGR